MTDTRVWGLLDITPQRAQQIKEWRTASDGTYGHVADLAVEAWIDELPQGAKGSVILGIDLCQKAGEVLDENSASWVLR